MQFGIVAPLYKDRLNQQKTVITLPQSNDVTWDFNDLVEGSDQIYLVTALPVSTIFLYLTF